jgi:hypothetical protein
MEGSRIVEDQPLQAAFPIPCYAGEPLFRNREDPSMARIWIAIIEHSKLSSWYVFLDYGRRGRLSADRNCVSVDC